MILPYTNLENFGFHVFENCCCQLNSAVIFQVNNGLFPMLYLKKLVLC